MLVDGKKYACDACVRGHRVTGCQHHDRLLQEIQKKGRPVSQCQHCRTMRKSRSAHIKCECGEKIRGQLKRHYIDGNGIVCEMNDIKDSCQCPDGGRCLCSIKKEPTEHSPRSIPSTGFSVTKEHPRKPRLQSIQSEGSLPKLANVNNHKPLHRFNSCHSKLPYQRPQHIQNADHIQVQPNTAHIMVEPWGDLVTTSVHPPLVLREIPSVPYIKQEHDCSGLDFPAYQDDSEFPQSTSVNADPELSIPPTENPVNLSLLTDFSQFKVPDYLGDQFYSAGSENGSQYSTYFTPTSVTWPYEPNMDRMFDFMPALSQSLSGDDSEVDQAVYHSVPSPITSAPTVMYPNGACSTSCSDSCESDYPTNISSRSSTIGLSSLGMLTHHVNMDETSQSLHTDATEFRQSRATSPSVPNDPFIVSHSYSGGMFYNRFHNQALLPSKNDVLMMYQLNLQDGHPSSSNYTRQ